MSEIPAADWDALHDGAQPVRVARLPVAASRPPAARAGLGGWAPCHIGLWDGAALVAAPGYLKTNSHGEFVFDHAWARAYMQHGLDYFPKWLGAVPYSPV